MVDKSFRVNLVMNPDIVKQIDIEADKLCISRSAYINMAVTTYLAQQQALKDLPVLVDALRKVEDLAPSVVASATDA